MSKPVMQDLFALRDGRRNRKSFALNLLCLQIPASVALGLALLFLTGLPVAPAGPWIVALKLTALFLILAGVCLIAVISVATATQRLRDMGVSGWAYLATFLPVIGQIFTIVLLIWPSEPRPNRYGPPVR